jgi:hypothetical protein
VKPADIVADFPAGFVAEAWGDTLPEEQTISI